MAKKREKADKKPPAEQADERISQIRKQLLGTAIGLHVCDQTDRKIGEALDDMEPKYQGEAERLRQRIATGQASPSEEERYLACLRSQHHARLARGHLAEAADRKPVPRPVRPAEPETENTPPKETP